ncbi:triacylglycerol lipase [Gordonia hirsuta DSM 44140 = NBRC 16056]|uniref:Triacylglycerol lipase n=1 Tax=Gordonia hirsuta DSM 44140 = NBRC 16056 TaxID=1121927 RepID=L7L7G1_9ACTN|nr:alpha/beta fold hydrolase [Gordonia hirsuta]GAC57085.1 triacylglycerol lipase [Gordonia hirsuta DSM 44140 = NBRC 16056]
MIVRPARCVRPGFIALTATAAMLVAALGAGAGSAAAAPPYPVVIDAAVATVTGDLQPAETVPPGANVPGCRSEQPPVVLLHGTAQNQMSAWQYLAPTLANAGYCVHSLTYGQTSWSGQVGGLGQREKSARQVAAFVDRVLASSGAGQIDLIGFSQGSAVAQLLSQLPGRAAQIRHLIGLGPSNKGVSTVGSIADRLPARGPGVNDWGPLHPGIDYLMVMTRYDEVAAPYTNGYLPARPNVRNVVVQQQCPGDRVGHIGLPYDSWVAGTVVHTLAGTTGEPRCTNGFGY